MLHISGPSSVAVAQVTGAAMHRAARRRLRTHGKEWPQSIRVDGASCPAQTAVADLRIHLLNAPQAS
jgi:hypothetical protein